MFSNRGSIINLQLPSSGLVNALFSAVILLLLSGAIWLNYYSNWLAPAINNWQNFLYHFLVYLVLFATPFLLQHGFYGSHNIRYPAFFYAILLAAPLAFACRVAFTTEAITDAFNPFNRLVISRAVKTIFLLFCTAALWYGIGSWKNMQNVFCRPPGSWRYLLWLLPMMPFVVFAAAQPSFKATYPMVLKAGGNGATGMPAAILYELLYITDIAGVEFFFRGLLVVALAKICGPRAIISAACLYCAIHFGKPMAEAISSFFGGLFLGWLSYKTRSIWVCIALHAGLAIMMEVLAFI